MRVPALSLTMEARQTPPGSAGDASRAKGRADDRRTTGTNGGRARSLVMKIRRHYSDHWADMGGVLGLVIILGVLALIFFLISSP